MDKKGIILAIVTGLVLLGIVIAVILFTEKEYYEVAIQLKSQNVSDDPAEDMRNSFKKGDPVIIYPKGYSWSETEKTSYLILKMDLSEAEAKEVVKSRIELIDAAPGEVQEEKIVLLRKYKINLDEIGFKEDDVKNGQPFENKVFGWEVVAEK